MDPEASCIHFLISHGACITQRDDYKQTPLHHAALRGDEVACEQLLIYQTPERSLVNVSIHYLISHGACITQKDDYKQTPLHHAALRGDEVACEQLLIYQTPERSLVNVSMDQIKTSKYM